MISLNARMMARVVLVALDKGSATRSSVRAERGQRAPSLDVVGRLANRLNVTPAELFGALKRQYRPRFRSRVKFR